ncbi:MAG TPA: hypothetical protein VMV15_03425 [Candidatus Binataceae bacterium]|nr:hypothetical protein [Candidatus Binataceae bacterium]
MKHSSVNQRLIVIGYGSLLSGYGLLAARRGARAAHSRLIARKAFPVILQNARRGLAKPSSHGDYLAMDLEPLDRSQPIRGYLGVTSTAVEGLGALGLEFDLGSAAMIARREEYAPDQFVALIDRAEAAGSSLGDFLYRIAERGGFDLLAYRTALRAELGYTSPGYIFHPLPLEDGRVAIVAIGSGFEGSGDPAVQSRRSETGMDRLLTLAEALAVTTLALDREGQLGYFVECALGGFHGTGVGDLLGEADGDHWWRRRLGEIIRAVASQERARFLEATSIDEDYYRRNFAAAPHPSLTRLLAEAKLG